MFHSNSFRQWRIGTSIHKVWPQNCNRLRLSSLDNIVENSLEDSNFAENSVPKFRSNSLRKLSTGGFPLESLQEGTRLIRRMVSEMIIIHVCKLVTHHFPLSPRAELATDHNCLIMYSVRCLNLRPSRLSSRRFRLDGSRLELSKRSGADSQALSQGKFP